MGFKYTDNLWCNSCYLRSGFLKFQLVYFPMILFLIAEMFNKLMMRVHFVNKFVVVNENDSKFDFSAKL